MKKDNNCKWQMDEEWLTEYVARGGGFGTQSNILSSEKQFEIWKWGRKLGLFENRDEFCSLINLIG